MRALVIVEMVGAPACVMARKELIAQGGEEVGDAAFAWRASRLDPVEAMRDE